MTNRERLRELDGLLDAIERFNLLDRRVSNDVVALTRAAVEAEGITWVADDGLHTLVFRAQRRILLRMRARFEWSNGIELPPWRRQDEEEEESVPDARRRSPMVVTRD